MNARPIMVVPGAIDAARLHDLHVLLVGDTPKVEAELAKLDLANVHFDIVQADDVVHMNEKPSDILRRKKNASIQVACRLVKDGKADAVVSAGHSGATVACGMFIMGRLPGVERPALAALLPTEKNPVVVLDAGANVDCRPYHLFQFGLMGDAFARDLLGYAAPRVSLLSIGEEEGKGNSQVKEAYELLKLAQNLNFVGNAEGRDIFTGDIDVVVCDGFVGNVVVKMSEGLASALVRMLKRLFTSGFLPALGGMLAKGAFKKFATTIDYAEYGGAPLLGLQGLPRPFQRPRHAERHQDGRYLRTQGHQRPSCRNHPGQRGTHPLLTRHLSHGYFYEAKLLSARPQQLRSRRGPDQR